MTSTTRPPRRKALIVGISVAITLFVVVVAMNFMNGGKKITRDIPHLYSVGDPSFLRAMGIALGPSVVEGNRVDALLNGDEIFPSMLSAIRGAEKSVNFQTYIYLSGDIGRQFALAFAERARAGVPVHVLVDWVGSGNMDAGDIKTMVDAGVTFVKYRPLRWYNVGRFNNRTHRKLLIVDGRIGFTGGVGIADMWTGHAQDPDHWRDSHFRIEGPAVGEMQAGFLDNWIEATGRVLHGAVYFPPIAPAGGDAAQMFVSSPTGGGESMELMYLLAIAAAERSIHLSSAYFIPDALARDALVAAVKRGVKVQIIIPGPHMDQKLVRGASRADWGELLAAGVEMYEYQPSMYHCKVLIVDDLFVSVGSTNFDPRSFRLNDEANLNIYNGAFAHKQVETFRDDLTHSKRITLAQWRTRPVREKIGAYLASLFGRAL